MILLWAAFVFIPGIRADDRGTCNVKSDVIFLLDHSGSIRDRNPANGSWDNWELIKDFVVSIVEGLDVGYEKTHVGLATFGNYAISRFQLNAMFEVPEIVKTIRALGPGNGNTNTYEGLKLVRNMFALDRGGRYGVPHIAIVITDGKATINAQLTVPEATAAYHAGITVFAIGITDDIDEKQLRSISSPPQLKDQNYWTTLDFTGLSTILKRVQNATCSTPAINETGCRSLDLVFATTVPSSKSDWTLARSFLNEFLNYMPIGSSSVRVSLVTYDLYTVNNPFWLNSYFDKEALKQAIDSIAESQYSAGQSNPTLALVNIRTKVFTEANGFRPNGSQVVVLMLSDTTLDNQVSFENEVKQLSASTHVVAVDIRGNLVDYLSRLLATRRNVISTGGYTFMASKVAQLANVICSQQGSGVACPGRSDIVLAVDTSSGIVDYVDTSAVWTDYYLMFLKSFVQAFDVSQGQTRFSVLTYDVDVTEVLTFESCTDSGAVERAIDGIRPSGKTKVNLVNVLRKSNSVLLESKRNAPKILLLVSYEYPVEGTTEQVLFQASLVKEQAHVFLVGITLARSHEPKVALWTNVSTNADTVHLYVVDEFTRLNSFFVLLIDNVCQHLSEGLPPLPTTSAFVTPIFTTSEAPVVIRPADCKAVDLAILLDTTTNIGRDFYYQYVIPTLQGLILRLPPVESGSVKVAVVTFAKEAFIEFYFNTYTTSREVIEAIGRLPHRGFKTNLGQAITMATDRLIFSRTSGARMDAPVNRVMVVVTSNPSEDPNFSVKEAKKAHGRGIFMAVVGVGTHLNIHELSAIATYPYRGHLLLVNSARELPTLVEGLARIVCFTDANCKPNNPCLNGGNCTEEGTGVRCQCPPSRAGPFCESRCSTGSDVAFILDSSRSKTLAEFQSMTSFVSEVIQRLDVNWPDDGGGTRVALMTAGDDAKVRFHLNEFKSKKDLLWAANVPFDAGTTCDSGKALRLARESVFNPWNGARTDRRKVVVFITDGLYDNETSSWIEAVASRRQGISIVAVGIGSRVNKSRLSMMASEPHSQNILLTSNYDELSRSSSSSETRDALVDLLCANVDYCSSGPCKNGAVCKNIVGGFLCGPCPEGSTGTLCERDCSGEVDIVFALFVGSSIHRERLDPVKDFVVSIVNRLDVHPTRTRVSLVFWTEVACIHFHLDQYENRQDVVQAVKNVPFVGGLSDPSAALWLVRRVYHHHYQHLGGRLYAKKIAIFITNSESDLNSDTITQRSTEVREEGILVLTVGIGGQMMTSSELEVIASSPRSSNQFWVESFYQLQTLVVRVVQATCNSLDECSSNPCQNRGTCFDDYNRLYCRCRPGFAGSFCQRRCTVRLDLAIIIDVSGSVLEVCGRASSLGRSITAGLDLDSDLARVALVSFSTGVSSSYDLLRFRGDKRSALESFDFVRKGGRTNIREAFEYANSVIFRRENGDRPDVTNVIVIMTDGFHNVGDPIPGHGAEELKKRGVVVFVVGIGAEVHPEDLMVMASYPKRRHLFRLQANDSVDDVAGRLLDEVFFSILRCFDSLELKIFIGFRSSNVIVVVVVIIIIITIVAVIIVVVDVFVIIIVFLTAIIVRYSSVASIKTFF